MTETAEPVLGGLSLEQLDQLLDQVCGVNEQRRQRCLRPAGKCHRYALFSGLTVRVESPCRPIPGTYSYWAGSWAAAKSLEAACGDAARNDPGHRCMIHQVRSQGVSIISGSPGWIERAHEAATGPTERRD